MERVANFSQQLQFKGSMAKEYFLIASPDVAAWQQIMNEKMEFAARYGKRTGINSKPHIIIANFLAIDEMEETLLRWMHRVISTHRSFKVALNNYSGFPNADTIYLRVQDHSPFKILAKELKVIDELVKMNGLPKAHLITHPNLTIARGIDDGIYEKAMMEYAQKEFHAEFEVKELVLLKRNSSFDDCKQVSVFRLLP